MKDFPLPESRDECVIHYVRAAMRSVEPLSSFEKLSDLVMDVHLARHPDGGGVKWCRDKDQDVRQKANGQMLRRCLGFQRSTPLRASLEEAVVLALPPAYRDPCIADLVRRYGRIGVPIPDADANPELACVGRVCQEVGDFFQKMAPITADGRISVIDAPLIPAALREIEELLVAVLAMQAQLLQIQREALAEAAGI